MATTSFLSGRMGGDLDSGLIVPGLGLVFFFSFPSYLDVYVLQKPEFYTKVLYPPDVMYLIFL